MTTAKSTKSTASSSPKSAFEGFTMFEDNFKDSFAKSMSTIGDFTSFGKDNVEAIIELSTATTKGLESINTEAFSYSKQAVEDGIESAKAAMTARSVQELIEIQSSYTKSAVENYMGQMNKMTDMFSDVAREISNPVSGRWNAFVQLMQNARP